MKKSDTTISLQPLPALTIRASLADIFAAVHDGGVSYLATQYNKRAMVILPRALFDVLADVAGFDVVEPEKRE